MCAVKARPMSFQRGMCTHCWELDWNPFILYSDKDLSTFYLSRDNLSEAEFKSSTLNDLAEDILRKHRLQLQHGYC
jgi:hypothetical protein